MLRAAAVTRSRRGMEPRAAGAGLEPRTAGAGARWHRAAHEAREEKVAEGGGGGGSSSFATAIMAEVHAQRAAKGRIGTYMRQSGRQENVWDKVGEVVGEYKESDSGSSFEASSSDRLRPAGSPGAHVSGLAGEPQARKLAVVSGNRDTADQMYSLAYTNGNKFFGSLLHREPNGYGEKTYANGDWYNGDWRAGKKHGCGVFFHKRTCTTYDGEWRNNRRQGLGLLRRTFLGNSLEYLGHFERNQRHGEGELRWSDGRVLKGVWQRGELVKVTADSRPADHCRGFVGANSLALEFKPVGQADLRDLLQDDLEHDDTRDVPVA